MSDENDILKKINALNERANEIRLRNKIESEEEKQEESSTAGERRGAQAGSEFLASIIGGAILGYGIDWMFDIQPWGMLTFMILGFVSGTYRAQATMHESDEKTEKE